MPHLLQHLRAAHRHLLALARPSGVILLAVALVFAAMAALRATAAELPGDRMLGAYFRHEVAEISALNFARVDSLDDWKRQREQLRAELREMLGLSPFPERTPLHATTVGREEHPEFLVEKLHFQSLPGLYVTANLYLPRKIEGRVPAVLYISGHSRVREGNVSFGSKATYQHHGAWFARHGFVCLTIDSIGELAEIEGQHHGLHSGTRWWWSSRGYTPAGVETWNAMRALDYLEARPEVDPTRFGATGRSGGGIGTWWITALDDRIKAAVPVAGLTDLQNHVVDGKASRHCDCMYMVNTRRWDFAKVAALAAPRPLLFSNSDKDDIFPLDGVVRLHRDVASIYKLYNASHHLGLLITDGPHRDTQDLQVPAFRWLHRFLKGSEILVDRAATKFFTPAQLRVFTMIPADQRNTRIDEEFVPAAKPTLPSTSAEWEANQTRWLSALAKTSFAGWPAEPGPLQLGRSARYASGAVCMERWEFTAQAEVRLPLYVVTRQNSVVQEVRLVVLDAAGWQRFGGRLERAAPLTPDDELTPPPGAAVAYFAPRGIGPTAWTATDAEQIHVRRRFMLLGQTLEGMRVLDIRRALDALSDPALFPTQRIHLRGERIQAVNALYASLYARHVAGLELTAPPSSHAIAPDYLAVLKFLDVPQAVAMAAARAPVRITGARREDWTWPVQVARQLAWPAEQLAIEP